MIARKYIVYPGIEEPKTISDFKIEIAGLKNAIKIAEELISRYEQVLVITESKQGEMLNAPQAQSTAEAQEGERGEGKEERGVQGAEGQGPEESS